MPKAKVKQTLSLLLIFMLMIMPISNVSVRADTPLVSSIIMETSKGKQYINSFNQAYLVNSQASESGELNGEDCTAYFADGVLTLWNYSGGSISITSSGRRALTIVLMGDNEITVANNEKTSIYGIEGASSGTDLTITTQGETPGTLNINLSVTKLAGTAMMYGIATSSDNPIRESNLTIKGSANISIDADNKSDDAAQVIGLQAAGDVSILDNASLFVEAKATSYRGGVGLYSSIGSRSTTVTIDTTGKIKLLGTTESSNKVNTTALATGSSVNPSTLKILNVAELALYTNGNDVMKIDTDTVIEMDETKFDKEEDLESSLKSLVYTAKSILYTATVNSGTGGGEYAQGDTVNITANTAPAGKEFDKWITDDGVTFANANSASTSFTMPGKAVTVTATYKNLPIPKYAVAVNSGTGGGEYVQGDTVNITANTAPAGKEFDKWITDDGVTFANASSASTNFTMPGKAVTVTATYKDLKHTVAVNSGTGGGEYAQGDIVNITANTAPAGKEFDKWITDDGVTFANASSASTSFTMPGKAVTVAATYKDLPPDSFAINIQNDGNGTANASVTSAVSGIEITLSAEPNDGYKFKEWSVISGSVTISNNKFTMPADDVTIKAIFEEIPKEAPIYKITDGANGSWKKATKAGISITSNGDFAKFTGVKVDGALISEANYTAVLGSTVITLKAEYLETLSIGEHTVELVYSDGSVLTEITILAKDVSIDSGEITKPDGSPSTGDNSNLMLLNTLLLISGASLLGITLFSKKRSTNR